MRNLKERNPSSIEDEILNDPDYDEIVSLVHKGFEKVEPSQAVLDRIHQEAERVTMRKKAFWFRIRVLSAAASLAILVAGAFHLFTPEEPEVPIFTDTAEELLELQSLSDATYFSGEITLWE